MTAQTSDRAMREPRSRGCAASRRPSPESRPLNLQRLDVCRLQALRALLRFEAYLLIFKQRPEAVASDFMK
jgi:hypothetical protein